MTVMLISKETRDAIWKIQRYIQIVGEFDFGRGDAQ